MSHRLVPSDRLDRVYSNLRATAKSSLFFLAQGILGYKDLTKELHLPVSNFLQLAPWNCDIPESARKMLRMPRDHFKSTLASEVLPLYLAITRPGESILLLSAVEDNTKKWLNKIKWHLTRNSLLRGLFPEILPMDDARWSATEIALGRHEGGEASIVASSLASGLASRHFQHLILDDPMNEKIAQSESATAMQTEAYQYLDAVLSEWESSTFTFVGTPYREDDPMDYALEHEVRPGHRLLWSIGVWGDFEISPVLADIEDLQYRGVSGEPIFPSRHPRSKLEYLQRKTDPGIWARQWLCNPYDRTLSGMDVAKLGRFSMTAGGHLPCTCHPGHEHLIEHGVTVATVDPAFSRNTEAYRSAICVATKLPCRCRFLLSGSTGHWLPDELVARIVRTGISWQPWLTHLGIESAAAQITLKHWMDELRKRGEFPQYVNIVELKVAERSKDMRINGQQPSVNEGLWHIPLSMAESDAFLQEFVKWPNIRRRDLLDAWAYTNDLWSRPDISAPIALDAETGDMNYEAEIADLALGGYSHR